MPELEETKDQVVTYSRFDETDTNPADLNNSKLNQYVWENLPLTPEQKLEFRSLYSANAGGDGNVICHSSVESQDE